MRLIFLVFCSCQIYFACGNYFELALLSTSHVHSRVEQINQRNGDCSEQDAANDKCFGGVARSWTKIQELRRRYPNNSLLFDTGHQFRGTVWSSHYEGLANAFFMNAMGYDIMTLADAEFDYGLPVLRRFIDDLKFPVVLSNMDAGDTVIRDTYVTSHIFIINGEKVGVVGYISPIITTLQKAEYIKGLTFTNEVESVRREARKLESQGVQIIIAMGPFGSPVDFKVAKEVEELDIVIGSSHRFLYTGDPPSSEVPRGDYPMVIIRSTGRKALVVSSYAWGKYLGFLKVNFTIDGLNVHSWEGQPILLDASIPEDSEMMALVDEWSAPVSSVRNDTRGSSHVLLEYSNPADGRFCRRRECSLGNLVTDAVLWAYVKGRPPTATSWSDVSIAVWNSGAFGSNIQQGPVSSEDVKRTIAFRNQIVLVEVSRCVLLEMLENSVAEVERSSGRHLQVSGLRVVYNLNKPVGERVVSVLVRCTECIVPKFIPLEECGVYKVLTSAYLADGRNGYSMIPKKGRIDLGIMDEDAVSEYIQQFSPIITGLEGRLEYVKDDPVTPPPAPTPPPAAFPVQVRPCGDNQQNLPKGIVILSTNGLCIT